MANYDITVKVTGEQRRYAASLVPDQTWELHRGDTITLNLEWLGSPADAKAHFVDVNVSRPGNGPGPSPGHIVDGITSSNGKYHDPSQSWGQSPGPGWWGGGGEATIYRAKDQGKVEIYKIGGISGQEPPTTAIIEDVEVLAAGMDDSYYISGRISVMGSDGRDLSPPGTGVVYDPMVVNKGGGGRK